MSFHHIFYNNQVSQNIKKKVQKNTLQMFPRISQVAYQDKIKKEQVRYKKISSDKQIQKLCSHKKQIQTQKNNALYKMTTKDILCLNSKVFQAKDSYLKSLQAKDLSLSKQQDYQTENKQIQLLRKRNCQLDQKMTQTTRNINRLKTSLMARKIQILIQISQNHEISKKSVGNYSIIKELGHGGFAVVYEVLDLQSRIKYAMKQYKLTQSWQCYKNQSKVGQYYFHNNKIKQQFSECKGISSIVKFIQKIKINKKGYIVQQLCGINFSKLISQIKGTFYNKQRVYEVNFMPFYQKMKRKQIFLSVIIQICQGVKVLNQNGFVHCDLKLQNIMIECQDNQMSRDGPVVKIIDFGSTFQSSGGLPKITITPQYMPPQLLLQFDKNNCQGPPLIYDKIDVWSIGCILLQIFTGIPLWFRYKCKIEHHGKSRLQLGIFALTNRNYVKIVKRQKYLCQSLINNIFFVSHQWEPYRQILKLIFVMNPEKRISIKDLIEKIGCIK